MKELLYEVGVHRNQKAYGELFLHFYKPLTSFAVSIVKSREASEEIYSDVLLKLWDMGAALQNIENLQVFLYVAIKNASLNYLAKYHKLKTVDLDSVDAELLALPDGRNEGSMEAGITQTLARAIQALPPKGRLVYQLIKDEGLSYRQAAEILDISVNTVEGHMTTAMKKITASVKTYLRSGAGG